MIEVLKWRLGGGEACQVFFFEGGGVTLWRAERSQA